MAHAKRTPPTHTHTPNPSYPSGRVALTACKSPDGFFHTFTGDSERCQARLQRAAVQLAQCARALPRTAGRVFDGGSWACGYILRLRPPPLHLPPGAGHV